MKHVAPHVRVITGKFRGRRLAVPPEQVTRPFTDRVKESVFNILGHRFGTLADLPPVETLDLFAGGGSMGIEALSRGARACVFVEHDRRAVRVLRENLALLELQSCTRVVAENAWTTRPPAAAGAAGFGLVFVDPPYRDVEKLPQVFALLERLAPRLAPDGVLVFRHAARLEFPQDQLSMFQCADERVFGDMRVLLLAGRPVV